MARLRTAAGAAWRQSLRALLEAHGYHVVDEGTDGLLVSRDDEAAHVAGGATPGAAVPDADEPEPLTAREREVLALVAQGLSNRAIAQRLGVSPHTAKTHVSSIYGKLGAANRAEAVRRGIGLGLLEV